MDDVSKSSMTQWTASTSRVLPWLAIGLVVVVAVIAFRSSSSSGTQTANVGSQGTAANPVSIDGASLQRGPDGVRVRIEMPTPMPGSYEYPTSDMVPPEAPEHPELLVAGPGESETFTLWIFIFNHPELCTDACNLDDLDPDADAKGGVYQGDGRIADSDQLVLEGGVRVGQEPMTGAPLENPLDADVHLAIAPHGMALEGRELWRQLNGPIGNPTLWWPAAFPAAP